MILTAILAIGTSGCHSGGNVATNKKGHIKWKIIEAATGKVIGQGDRDIQPADITSETINGGEVGDLVRSQLTLSDHFRLALAQGDQAAQSGFGFTVDKDDERVFAWEWFMVNGDHAKKLQESGELSFESDSGRIVRTVFDTDVSMRVVPLAAEMEPSKPTWRIEIAKGSVIDWPR